MTRFNPRSIGRLSILLAAVVCTFLALAAYAQDSAIIHYHRPDDLYAGWGLHVWDGAAQETQWSEPLPPTGEDEFGVFWQIPLKADAQELGFVIHRGEVKDPGSDMLLDLTVSKEAWVVTHTPQLYTEPVDPAAIVTGMAVTEEPAPPQFVKPASEAPLALGDGLFVQSAILHDSRSDFYRTPSGAQPINSAVTLRLRTAAADVEHVALLVDEPTGDHKRIVEMERTSSDGAFDWWQAAIDAGDTATIYNYRFRLTDGGATIYYYMDDARDGGDGMTNAAQPNKEQGWKIYTYSPHGIGLGLYVFEKSSTCTPVR